VTSLDYITEDGGPASSLYGSYATSFFPLQDAQPNGETLKPILGRQVEFGQRFHLPARIDVNTAFYYQAVRTTRSRGRVACSIRPARSGPAASHWM